MRKFYFILFLLATLFLSTVSVAHAKEDVNLPVPFTSEAPGGNWVDPWFNGCEEASVVMVDQYYLGKKKLSRGDAERLMLAMFAWEDKTFGSNTDTNATETVRIINEYSSFDGMVKRNPTLLEIKKELREGRPVIAPLDGFALYGILYGNGYHMLVLKGYDDSRQEFIVHDDGKSKGDNFRYSYGTIMGALSDFDHATKKINGVRTAIFTRPRSSESIAPGSASNTVGAVATESLTGQFSAGDKKAEDDKPSMVVLYAVLAVIVVGGGGLLAWRLRR
ncbi:MAG TPA: C39 family peptidase [Patescibacteria group bacterium]|nr:C39 family peptidase [Patescibacteria group bacterium]